MPALPEPQNAEREERQPRKRDRQGVAAVEPMSIFVFEKPYVASVLVIDSNTLFMPANSPC
jgi:hypothetical protein